MAGPEPAADPVGLYSRRYMAFFEVAFARTLAGRLRAIRVPHWGMPAAPEQASDAPPLIVLANHPSWWDGVAFMLLSRRLFPARRMFVPMEAASFRKYGFMRRLGVFGVEAGTPRGAAAFLRAAAQVLAAPGAMLWVNAPGRFVDARARPLPIAPGVPRLPELAPHAMVLPLAVEYPFWNESAPEMLAAFGTPVAAATLLDHDREARAAHIATLIGTVQDRLAADAITRDPARFAVVQPGREGMGGVYQHWRRLRAAIRGEAFDPRHEGNPGGAP